MGFLGIAKGALNRMLRPLNLRLDSRAQERADEVLPGRVEALAAATLFSGLEPNDFLFVDSSHEIRAGNDVLHLFLNVLPSLRPGVLVHVHDVFLPFEYPQEWVVGLRWNFA